MEALHDSNRTTTSTLQLRAAQCRGVILIEQEIGSKYKRHGRGATQQKIGNAFSNNNAVVGAIPAVIRVDGGAARQQQLHDVNVTTSGS